MKLINSSLSALAALLISATPLDAAPKVVASIQPIHSLVAGVMQDVAEPSLLIRPNESPHTYSLRPSDAQTLQSADLVFWVGPGLEAFLAQPLKTLAKDARIVKLGGVTGLTLLPTRQGGAFEAHAHDDHADDHDDAHKDENHDADTAHTDGKEDHHDEDTHGHAPSAVDLHIWLDPDNAQRLVWHIAGVLSVADPANAPIYHRNMAKMNDRIATLDRAIAKRLEGVQDRAYVVFHDAYQYFERHFGTHIVGSVTVSPDQPPGARRIAELRERIRTSNAVCVFREPQFPAPIVETLLEGTGSRAGVLDPEGASIPPGPDAYFTLMENMANSLADCLSPAS